MKAIFFKPLVGEDKGVEKIFGGMANTKIREGEVSSILNMLGIFENYDHFYEEKLTYQQFARKLEAEGLIKVLGNKRCTGKEEMISKEEAKRFVLEQSHLEEVIEFLSDKGLTAKDFCDVHDFIPRIKVVDNIADRANYNYKVKAEVLKRRMQMESRGIKTEMPFVKYCDNLGEMELNKLI